ncbi:transketolase [Mediterraneibacter sp. NSJ-55]|uniref:Transketolase n=1 Tax=Mediterraneibacter hominis TaxID=2763054 RepID=A0A923LHR4_9FIRM|nr:transketolase [Mediterraneibacter hominis]MBC5688538.1 transketolase [Mediterraneibacter hominis]
MMKLTTQELEQKAKEIRRVCLELAKIAGSEGAHVGPALSFADIAAVLYFDAMTYKPEEPDWEERDRFILSKGHGVLGLYAPLIVQGMISREEMRTFNHDFTRLAGHPSGKGLKGIEHPAGSLGHGLSVSCGIAYDAKVNKKTYHTYVLLGDGENGEGSVWEAVMFAAEHGLDNLTAIVDANGYQYGGVVDKWDHWDNLAEKWKAFGWNVKIVDGHDIEELREALDKTKSKTNCPTCVIAKTIKGKGIAEAENNNNWHHIKLSETEYCTAMKELE